MNLWSAAKSQAQLEINHIDCHMLLKSNWRNSAVLAVHKLGSAVLLSVETTVQEQRLQYSLPSRGSQYRDCGEGSSPFFPFHAASSAFLLILRSNRASEMAQWIKPPTSKPDNLSSILGPFRSLRSGKNVSWGCNRMISNPYRQIAKCVSLCSLGQPYISQLKAHAQSIMRIHEMANGVFINLLIYLVLLE